MATEIVIHPPLAGVIKSLGFQKQPPYSAIHSNNFWPVNASDGRRVTATRPPVAEFASPGTRVNLFGQVNGDGTQIPQQTLVCARAGVLYVWDGSAWQEVDDGESDVPEISQNRPVYTASYLQQVIIANNGEPLVFDYGAASAPRLTEITPSAGTVPTDCRIVASWQGGIWLAGQPATPHILYGSASGDITDWDFSATNESAAFATTGENEGTIGAPITALIPQTADTMIVGCRDCMYALRAHPRRGGIIESISSSIGPLGQGAWCKAPDDTLFILTATGMVTLPPHAGAVPAEVSRRLVPDSLIGLDFDSLIPVVSMAYSVRHGGVYIFVRGEQQQGWFYDIADGGFHPTTLEDYPYVTQQFDLFMSENACGVLLGGDGYGGIGRFDSEGSESFSSEIAIGPIKLSRNSMYKSVVRRTRILLGLETSLTGTVKIWTGQDGEECYNNYLFNRGQRKFEIPIETLLKNNLTCYPGVAGHAMILEFEQTDGRLVFEESISDLQDGGRATLSLTSSIAPDVSAGPDQLTVLFE